MFAEWADMAVDDYALAVNYETLRYAVNTKGNGGAAATVYSYFAVGVAFFLQ